MAEIVVFVVILISCFISGFELGFHIKQRLYEALLKSWENATKEHCTNNHELLMEVVQSYDNFFAKHKECLLLAKRNSPNDCTGCEHINDDSGYCYDCYNCSKKYVKGGGDG